MMKTIFLILILSTLIFAADGDTLTMTFDLPAVTANNDSILQWFVDVLSSDSTDTTTRRMTYSVLLDLIKADTSFSEQSFTAAFNMRLDSFLTLATTELDTTNFVAARRAEWRGFIATDDSVDQDVTTGASPEFANINITDSTSTDKLHITDIASYDSDRDITDLYHLTDKRYVDEAVTALGARYYMLDYASGEADYKSCSTTVSTGGEQSVSGEDLANDDYVQGWIAPNVNEPDKLLLWRIYAEKTGGTKTLRLYWKLVERKNDDSEVVIATSVVSNEVVSGKNSYIIPLNLAADYDIASDSYVVGKIYADVSGGGSAPDITLYYEGSSHSHWQIPVNTEILDNLYVKKAGDTMTGTLNLPSDGLAVGDSVVTESDVANWDATADNVDQDVTIGAAPVLSVANMSGLPTGSAAAANRNEQNYIQNAFAGDTVYVVSPFSEYDGDGDYTSGIGKGYYIDTDNGLFFNKIGWKIEAYYTGLDSVKLYIYESDSALLPTTTISSRADFVCLDSLTIDGLDFPWGVYMTDCDSIFEVTLDRYVYIEAGKTCNVFYYAYGGKLENSKWGSQNAGGTRTPFYYLLSGTLEDGTWYQDSSTPRYATPLILRNDAIEISMRAAISQKMQIGDDLTWDDYKVTHLADNGVASNVVLADTVWFDPGGWEVYRGDDTYSQWGLGIYEQMTETVVFDQIAVKMYMINDGPVEVKVLKSDHVHETGTVLSNMTLIDSLYYYENEFNADADAFMNIKLSNTVLVEKGKYLYVLIVGPVAKPRIVRWTTKASRKPMLYSIASGTTWDAVWHVGGSSYRNTGMILTNSKYTPNNVNFFLPDTLWAVDGIESNIYYKNCLLAPWENYEYVMHGDVGKNYRNRYSLTPTSTYVDNVGLEVMDWQRGKIDGGGCVVVASDSGLTDTTKIMLIGDSLTDIVTYPEALNGLDTLLVFIGTQNTGNDAQNEGYGGKTYSWFATDASSPFVNSGVIDFANYFTTNGFDDPEFVIIGLGTNDGLGEFLKTRDYLETNSLTYCDLLVDSLLAYNSAIKIGLVAPIMAANQDAFGYVYDTNYSAYCHKTNMHLFARMLYERYGEGGSRKNSQVWIVPHYCTIDTDNDFPTTTVQLSARNSSTYDIQSNALHPASAGYEKMADCTYAWIKAHE